LQKAVTIPVHTWDERLTTVQAQRFLIETGMRREKRKERVDQTAAAILLQSYLDRASR
jgi:putative Holliday junction resolvase